MVTSNSSWEEQTRRFLSDTLSELNKVELQIQELEGRRAKLKEEAQAWEMALEGYLRRTGREFKKEPDWFKLFGTQTHKQKLITIAEYNGGRIKASGATNVLFTKGFIKAKKRSTAYSMVQRFLIEMGEEGKFEKVGPGEYRLIGAQQNLLS